MLALAFLAATLATQSLARTYDYCPGYASGIIGRTEYYETDAAGCLAQCDSNEFRKFLTVNLRQWDGVERPYCYITATSDEPFTKISDPQIDGEKYYVNVGVARSVISAPFQPDMPEGCVVCRTDTCTTCKAPNVYSTTGDCLERCPPGQLPNAGRGCVPCPDLECTGLCGAPAYYSSESGACVLPTVVTEIPAVVTSTTTTGFPTVTVKLVSTTTPATSTITALTTAFTGRAACSYYRVTFPEDCCPNKYVTGLRRVRIRRDESKLERRSIAFTTTTLAPVTTTRTVKGRFPPVTVTVSSFVEAPTPLTTTSTTAFAQSTACISTTRTGFGRCPTDPKAAVEALLKKYQESGERVVIDCGATGLYEQA